MGETARSPLLTSAGAGVRAGALEQLPQAATSPDPPSGDGRDRDSAL